METTIYVNDISQTFYQIRTQQPHTFGSLQEPPIPTTVNSSQIKLNWNFDKILAKYNNLTTNFILNNTEDIKDAQLPYINIINIDISGKNNNNINGNNYSGWLNLATLNILNDSSYNIDTYKEFIINKTNYSSNTNINNLLTNSNSFDIRIYGINNSINYPTIENRSLLFEQLRFQAAEVPTPPRFRSSISQNESLTTLNLTFFVNETELGFLDSNALINKLEISYNLADTFRSSFNTNETISSPNTIDYSNPLYGKNTDFSITLNNLMPGSNYNFEARVQNNLNDNSFSNYSDLSLTNYTLLPDSSGIGTTINTNINGNISYVTNSTTLSNAEIIYINLSDSSHKLMYENSNQNIEITNPNASTTGSQAKGFGKSIDNSLALVTINVSVNSILKQRITFDGSFGATDGSNNAQYNYISLPSNSLRDIYYIGDNNDKGFRLEGRFQLEPISNNNIVNALGDASINPYILNYSYIRHPDIDNQYNQDVSYTIYIDDLSTYPIVSENSTAITVNNVIYNMGIPSVQEFSIDFNRNYSNINSQYNYLQGTNIIGIINNINNTSATNSSNISILNTNIVSDGSYSFNNVIMESKTSSYYKNINYSVSILAPDYSLMYIDGKFQSNKSQTYPNINDYSYNGVNINNDFSGGNVNYDLNGLLTTTINSGYKYIVFELKKNPNNATTNGSYIFNNSVYNIVVSGDGFKYLSIKNLLNGFFDTTLINNIFNINSNDAIAFCRTTLVNTNYNRIGNLKMSFNAIGGNWLENGGINTGYNGSLVTSYGCKVENSSTNDLGIYISYTALNDDLTLFIGVKNN